jgi:hypothetical protein
MKVSLEGQSQSIHVKTLVSLDSDISGVCNRSVLRKRADRESDYSLFDFVA